jgi:glycosyltransferase involved in cell wall biosynthesis
LIRRSTLVLTTGIGGADGLSLLSREVASALTAQEGKTAPEIWSLMDDSVHGSVARSARGSRVRYASWALLESAAAQRGRRIVSLHAHLLPIALPLVHRGAQLIHFVVGVDSWKPLSRLQAAALARAWRIVSISRHSAREFQRENPAFGAEEVPVCHPGLPDFASEIVASDRGYALVVGRMSSEERYKGHDLLLEVWGEVVARQRGAELIIVGDGDDRARLEEKAKRLGLAGAVRFLGKIPTAALDRVYQDCSFFVMPSRHEGFGFVFLEAMRAAKACIGGRGAASEIIEDRVTGYLVDPDDAEAVRSAIVSLFSDPAARKRMGSNGRARFRSCFTRERFQQRFHQFIGEH